MIQLKHIWKWYNGVPLGLAIRILILPVTLTIMDFSVTLSFQPTEYWEGERTALLEANPVARWVLMFHPLLIVPAIIVWYILIFPLIFKTPAKVGLRVVVVLILGHIIAISGWLIRMCEDWLLWVALLIGIMAILTACILLPFRRQWNAEDPIMS